MLYWLWGKGPGGRKHHEEIFTVPILESIFKEIEKKI